MSMIHIADLGVQTHLLHIVQSDDLYLKEQADVLWFDLLQNFDYRPFQPLAARYYQALFQFNEKQAIDRQKRQTTTSLANPETQHEATGRLLFERATLCPDAPLLHPPQPQPAPTPHVDPRTLRPGHPPQRLAGREPKCFFALFQAFLGVALRGRAPEPESVYEELTSNPSFARTCGFTLPAPNRAYRHSDTPSLRKIEQFDQIMTQHGLWGEASLDQVARNLHNGRIQAESTLVHDTTHFPAYSSMQVVEVPESSPSSPSPKPGAKNPKGERTKKKKRKSHPKTTKPCRCPDRQHCPHPWVSADEGAGTVTKSTGMYWAHKASTLGFPGQEILLDAVAMGDAASHDSKSLTPHLHRLFDRHPQLESIVTRVLDDGAADDPHLKLHLHRTWGIELLAPINPRRRHPLRDDLPRGIDHITPTGTPVCRQGYPFEFLGTRRDTERFLFRAPDHQGQPVCQGCPQRAACYRGESGARQVTIACERLPWIDPHFPQPSRRFQKAMAKRTSIERLHKLMKYDFGDPRLTKRGNAAFQARLDKTILVMHLVIAHD